MRTSLLVLFLTTLVLAISPAYAQEATSSPDNNTLPPEATIPPDATLPPDATVPPDVSLPPEVPNPDVPNLPSEVTGQVPNIPDLCTTACEGEGTYCFFDRCVQTNNCEPGCEEGSYCFDGSCYVEDRACEPNCEAGKTCKYGYCINDEWLGLGGNSSTTAPDSTAAPDNSTAAPGTTAPVAEPVNICLDTCTGETTCLYDQCIGNATCTASCAEGEFCVDGDCRAANRPCTNTCPGTRYCSYGFCVPNGQQFNPAVAGQDIDVTNVDNAASAAGVGSAMVLLVAGMVTLFSL